MDRRIFTTNFADATNLGWPCPFCERGTLVVVTKESIRAITAESDFIYEETGDPEMLDICISFVLKCSDSKCKEKVICLAHGSPLLTDRWDESKGDHVPVFEEIYKALFFYPHLKIFRLKDKVSPTIRKYIYSSFNLFFCNPGSSLGNLRIALEELLNYLGVKKYVVKNKRKVRISLHERINCLSSKFHEIKELCFAIKWHGNAGSHSSDDITKDDVLDAYEIFEMILDKFFDERGGRIRNLAKRINKQKGIRKSKKK